MKFKKFVGPFLNGKNVVIYKDGDYLVAIAETTGGKRVRFKEAGRWHMLPKVRLNSSDFEEWEDRIQDGLHGDDVRITQRFLEGMGYPNFVGEAK